MESQQLSVDWIGSNAYEQLRRAAMTHREDLVIRLGAETGLRPSEMSRLTPAHVVSHDGHHFIRFSDSNADTRIAYLPDEVEHDLRKYVESEGIAPNESVFDITPRRIQMLIREVATRASEETGNEQLVEVSSRDLRNRFARSLLVEHSIPLRVVQTVGGWDGLESLRPYLDPIEMDDIAAAFDRSENDRVSDPPVSLTDVERGVSGRLRRIIDTAADLGEALATVSTQTQIQRTVCEQLTATENYRFAWAGDVVGGERVIPREHENIEIEAIETFLDEHTNRVSHVIASREVQRVSGREHRGRETIVLVPVVAGDTVRGMLGIGIGRGDGTENRTGGWGVEVDTGRSNAVCEMERKLLAAVGVQVGHTLDAVEHKRLLLADTVIELTIQCTDDGAFFAAASAALDCTFQLSGLVPIEGDSLLCFLLVTGSTPEEVLTFADDATGIDRARLVRNDGDSALIECAITDDPAVVVFEQGGTIQELVAEEGRERLVGEVATDADTRSVIDSVTNVFPDSYLVSKREREKPVETKLGLRESLNELLTAKQESALRVAYLGGYFEWPRGSTAEELADSMGVSSPTLHNHLRNAQQKLLTAFFTPPVTPEEE